MQRSKASKIKVLIQQQLSKTRHPPMTSYKFHLPHNNLPMSNPDPIWHFINLQSFAGTRKINLRNMAERKLRGMLPRTCFRTISINLSKNKTSSKHRSPSRVTSVWSLTSSSFENLRKRCRLWKKRRKAKETIYS